MFRNHTILRRQTAWTDRKTFFERYNCFDHGNVQKVSDEFFFIDSGAFGLPMKLLEMRLSKRNPSVFRATLEGLGTSSIQDATNSYSKHGSRANGA